MSYGTILFWVGGVLSATIFLLVLCFFAFVVPFVRARAKDEIKQRAIRIAKIRSQRLKNEAHQKKQAKKEEKKQKKRWHKDANQKPDN